MIKNYNITIINLITFIHIFLIVFIILTPYTHDQSLIKINIFIIIFLLYSWILDSFNHKGIGRCGLTQLECKLRGIKYQDGFIYKIIKPFKIIDDRTCSILIIIFMIYWIYFNYNNQL